MRVGVCVVTPTGMFGFDGDSDDGRCLKVEWCEGGAGRRGGDGG